MDAVDVFIPYHRKDRHVLAYAVASAFRHLVPRPARVVCVGGDLPPEILAGIAAAGGERIDECSLAEIPHRSAMAEISVRGEVRTGWYYQQFLKWGFRKLAKTKAYVVLDADSILVAPLVLWADGKYVIDRTIEHHPPYFATFRALLGWRPAPADSFIINYQIIDVALLNALIHEIEARAEGQVWHQRILGVIDRTEASAFSEFETYGYWLADRHPGIFISRPGRNHNTKVKYLPLRWWINLRARFRGCTTVSYHQFRRD